MKFTTLAIAAACVAATPAWAQEFSANEERGCALFAKLTGSSATREECRGLIASNKKNRDLLACTTAAAMARVARLNEAPNRRPPDVTDAMQVACAMMIYDKSQEQVEAAFSRVK